MRKRFLLPLLVLLMTTLSTHAYDFQSGDLYYNITSENTVEVAYQEYWSTANYQGLTTATIPATVTYNGTTYSVTSIGDEAFRSCSSLTSITIPNSVTSIGYQAFDGCSSLTSLTIPNSVTSIGAWAFNDCSSLTSITIPNSVTSIGGYAFYGCTSLPVVDNVRYADTYLVEAVDKSLSTYTIKAGTKWIGSRAFSRCSSLTSITIPNSVTSIGYGAFRGCSALPVVDNLRYADTYLVEAVDKSLSTYTIKAGTTWIGDEAFYECSSLTSITIPNSVTSIGSSAFSGCSALTSITIPESVTSIGSSAFSGCSALTSITIPESVTSIGSSAFSGCSALTSITIPESVTSIGYEAFYRCSALTSITIPESVTSIGSFAFNGCSSLTSITIPNFVTSIGDGAFKYCSSLTSITIPNSVTSIGDGAFYECSSLSSITIPNSVTSIGRSAFENCSSLTSITIPESITSIKSGTFDGCSALTSITIPNSVTSIGYGAFSGCSSLTSITIPNSVTSIGESAFSGCSSLTSITIPNSVTSIGEEAFKYCSSLTSITIPNSVTTIGNYAFDRCKALTSVVWNAQDCKGWTDAANAPFRSSREQITSFTFGNQVETIPAYLCDSMVNIKEINIPNSVKTIREGVFNNNVKLAKVTIGTSVETIEANAFAGCRRLYDIYCYPIEPPFAENNSFANYNVYVYVPCENQRDYTLDVVWGEFKFIECIGSEVVVLPDDTVTVSPNYEDATFTWPSNDGADTYALVITKDDITFCTLVFNAQGQLVSIAFKPRRQNAPAEEGTTPATYAEMTANGFRFKVTGLDEGSAYAYTFTVRNAANSVLETYTGEFTTLSNTPTGIQESAGDNTPAGQAEKILQNGQVLIIRNGVTYDMMGQRL